MPKRRARRSLVIRGLIGVAAVVLAVIIVWALLVPGADWLARHDIGSAKGSLATARDAARGRLLTLGAGLFAAGALLFTARSFTLSREGQVTDRFTKAIEQLGSKELDVRIGGIYALERVARDSAKDHPTVMEVLTAFIRRHSREPWPAPLTGRRSRAAAESQERVTRPDVQAAVTVIGRRNAKRDILPIDLSGADLSGADLTRATLARALYDVAIARAHLDSSGTKLDSANLTRARLIEANLTRARLTGVNLSYARLEGADLSGANLLDANLALAQLTSADLTRADLIRARLFRANLWHANLTRADLDDADLTRARLTDANLSRATLTDANLTRADLTGAIWPEGVPIPDGWMVDDSETLLPGRLKRAGELRGRPVLRGDDS